MKLIAKASSTYKEHGTERRGFKGGVQVGDGFAGRNKNLFVYFCGVKKRDKKGPYLVVGKDAAGRAAKVGRRGLLVRRRRHGRTRLCVDGDGGHHHGQDQRYDHFCPHGCVLRGGVNGVSRQARQLAR